MDIQGEGRPAPGPQGLNQVYLDTARLLTQVAPLVFPDNVFALKGGTAINLFVRDMPRLSVDLDLVFTDHRLAREDALAKINEAPWLLATGEDYRYPETVGGSPGLMTRFMHRYMDQVVQLATHSVVVRKVLLRAFNMLIPPTALFQPRVLFSVLVQILRPVLTPKALANVSPGLERMRQPWDRKMQER